MNMIMFTPSPGRRSLFRMKRKSIEATCDPTALNQLQYAKIVYEGVRFFVKYKNNPNFDADQYYKLQVKPKFENDVLSQMLLKRIISGTLKMS